MVLEAVVAEGSVSRAARRLHLSQSALSHSLNRLREAFGDPILVRQGRGMEPTARAVAALPEVRSLLARVGRLFADGGRFDPSTADRTVNIGASDLAASMILPAAVARMRKEAPAMRLRVYHAGRVDAPAMLRSGQLDLAVGVFNNLTGDLRSQPLLEERYLCAVAAQSALPIPVTEQDYLARDHVNVLVQGDVLGLVDEALNRRGLARRIAVTVAHFSTALALLRDTEMIYTGPAWLFAHVAGTEACRTFAPPVELPPFRTQMAWSQRTHEDGGLLWLRTCIADSL